MMTYPKVVLSRSPPPPGERAWAYALAAGGEAGVRRMLELVEAEMRVAMALTGCTNVGAIGPDILVRS